MSKCPISREDCLKDKCAWWVKKEQSPKVEHCAVHWLATMQPILNDVSMCLKQIRDSSFQEKR